MSIKIKINQVENKLSNTPKREESNDIFFNDNNNHENTINNIKCIKTIQGHKSFIYTLKELRVKLNNRNVLASAGGDKLIKIWDMEDYKNIGILQGHSDQILSLCEIKNQERKLLLSTGEDKKLILWDLENFSLLKIFVNKIHDNRIWKMTNFKNYLNKENFSNLIVSCGDDKTIKIFNFLNENIIYNIQNGNDKVTCLLQYNTNKPSYDSSDSKNFKKIHFLVTGDSGKNIKIFKLNYETDKDLKQTDVKINGNLMNTMKFHNNYISELKKIKWKKDNFTIASSSSDETINIINLDTFSCIMTLKGHVDKIYSIQPIYINKKSSNNNNEFNNEKKVYLASAGRDKSIKIWDIQKGIVVKTIDVDEDSIRTIICLKYFYGNMPFCSLKSFDVNEHDFVMLSAGSDSSIKIWK